MSPRARIENDPELKRFAHELQNTKEGAIYTRRWRLLKESLTVLGVALKSGNQVRIAHARANYIHLSDLCTESVIELENRHQWPA